MVKSYRGQEVDLNKLIKEQGNNMSLGNTNLNGRGDIVKHGEVVKTREERLNEWMKSHKEETSINLSEDGSSTKIEEDLVKSNTFEENKRIAKPRNKIEPKVEE